jgi:hypothetical protein
VFTVGSFSDHSSVQTLMPWIMMGVLSCLLAGWYLYGGLRLKKWSWLVPKLRQVDLWNGAAPSESRRDVSNLSWIQKRGRRLLDGL